MLSRPPCSSVFVGVGLSAQWALPAATNLQRHHGDLLLYLHVVVPHVLVLVVLVLVVLVLVYLVLAPAT